MNKPIYVASPKGEYRKPVRITLRGCLSAVIILVGMIIGGVPGIITSQAVMANKIYPYWYKTDLYPDDLEIKEILSLKSNHYFFDGSDFSKDKLFIITKDDQPYMFYQNQWQPIVPLPNNINTVSVMENHQGDIFALSTQEETFILKNNQWMLYDGEPIVSFYSTDCMSEWIDPPPVKLPALDSEGINLGHDPSEFYRCYVLLEDGHLQVWTYSIHFFQILLILAVGAFLGALIGGIISFVIMRRLVKGSQQVTI